MRQGFIDRNQLGDPAYVNNPIQQLLSPDYAERISNEIKAREFHAPIGNSTVHTELTDTTHYSVMDAKGNAVAVTYTLNGFFGAGVIAGNTGFFLNNIMDDFATQPGKPNKFGLVQSDKNAIQPGKRPLSSMTPTIVMKDGRVVLVLGSPGGPRIITTVLQTLLNVFDYGMSIQDAANAPRFHYQVAPDAIDYEPDTFSFLTRIKLTRMGYGIMPESTWGAIEAIYVDPASHGLIGANDRRRPAGAAVGYWENYMDIRVQWIALIISAMLLSACATANYQPLGAGGGYQDSRLDTNTVRVTYYGNAATSQATVENYMLYRCAQVTLKYGYDYFIVASGGTTAQTSSYTAPGLLTTFNNNKPTSTGFYLPGQTTYFSREISTAVIKMYHGSKPSSVLSAYNAREIVKYVGPTTRM
jgi:hypothetical protein